MNEQTIVSASREQVSCQLEGDTVILNLKNSTYYELNPVAARIWDLMQTPTTIGRLRETILGEYDVSADRVGEEIPALLADLKQHELLVVHERSDADQAAPAG